MAIKIYPAGQRKAAYRRSKYPIAQLSVGDEFRTSITTATGAWSWRLYNRIRNAVYVHARVHKKTFSVVQSPAYSKTGPWEAVVTRTA